MSSQGDNEYKDYQDRKAIVNKPLQWTDLALSEQVKTLRFFRDKDNNILAMPVVFFDPTQTGLNVLPMGRVGISDPGALNSYARVFGLPCCGWPETTLGLVTHSTQMLQKGANLEARRTQTNHRYVTVSANGDTNVWVPTAGTRWRLLGLSIFMGGNCTLAAAGQFIAELRDGAVGIFAWQTCVNNAVINGQVYISQTIVFPDNGILSAAINTDLHLWLSAALALGSVTIMVWGTEEV